MKKMTVFRRLLLLVLIIFLCLAITATATLLAGAVRVDMFDFDNLNLSNMIPVLIAGGVLSCFTIGIACLFLGRTIFFKVKDYLSETENKDRRNEK